MDIFAAVAAGSLLVLAGESIGRGGEVSPAPAKPQVAPVFSFASLREHARTLAAKPYAPEPNTPLPEFLKQLTYDQYQSLRFRPEEGPWRGTRMRFSLQFFHRGYIYQDPVRIYLVDAGQVTGFRFSPQQFDYSQSHFANPVPPDLQFAGMRILYPLNKPGKQDEVATFIGATYFRLVGARQRYGAAGRGLTIDTAEPSGEEFPRFSEFWIEKPAAEASNLQFYALLDSPSAAGVFRFVLSPGDATSLEVEASLFLRRQVKKLGLAPLTSMMFKGSSQLRSIPDYRPQAHDSDGLLVASGAAEWSWRPLANPEKEHLVSQFPVSDLAGFGLFQRDRDFFDYEDLGTRFELRPTLWVQPLDKWGSGAIELVEIPTPSDANDNIIAYWLPGQKLAPGQELRWSYRISALLTEPPRPPLLRVFSTLINPPHEKIPIRFVIDFAGSAPPDTNYHVPIANIQVSSGKIQNLGIETNEVIGGWRTSFSLADIGDRAVDLRLYLHHGKRLSETWLYHLQVP